MDFQFAHIAVYSRSLPKLTGIGKKWTVSDILAEAFRVPEHSRHIDHPIAPQLWGMHPTALVEELDRRATMSADKRGHSIRKDAKVILGFVASWPERIPTNRLKFEQWVAKNLEFCQFLWGANNVKTLILHEDEMYPHAHIYVLPPEGANGCFNARRIHPGEIAKSNAAQGNETVAYKNAMRTFQDTYFEHVSQFFNIDRIGPRRARTSRANAKKNSLDFLVKEKEVEYEMRRQKLEKLKALMRIQAEILNSERFLASKIMHEEIGSDHQFQEYQSLLEQLNVEKLELIDNDGLSL